MRKSIARKVFSTVLNRHQKQLGCFTILHLTSNR